MAFGYFSSTRSPLNCHIAGSSLGQVPQREGTAVMHIFDRPLGDGFQRTSILLQIREHIQIIDF